MIQARELAIRAMEQEEGLAIRAMEQMEQEEGLAIRAMEQEEGEYQNIYNYLSTQQYPATLDDKHKRNFRRKCKDNFKLEDGHLKYRKKGSQQWKLYIARKKEKSRIFQSCHSSSLGKIRF